MKNNYLLLKRNILAKPVFVILFLFFIFASAEKTLASSMDDGPNLLTNPGFEDPADNDALINLADIGGSWQLLPLAEIQSTALKGTDSPWGTPAGGGAAVGNSNRTNLAFFSNGTYKYNGANIQAYEGSYSGRLQAGTNAGMYQLVPVEAGKTYAYSAWVLRFRANATNQSIIRPEYLRIRDKAGAVTLDSAIIALTGGYPDSNNSAITDYPDENNWMKISGTVTIPTDAPYDSVKFQISQVDYAASNKTAGTLIDSCDFHEVSSITGIPAVGSDAKTVNVFESNGQLQIVSGASNPIKEVNVYSIQGALVFKAAIQATSYTVKRNLPAGAYIVKVISEKNIYNAKALIR